MVQFIRTLARSLWAAVRRGAHERTGGTATLIALSAVPIIGFFGLAVDSGRGYMVKLTEGLRCELACSVPD